MNENSEESMSLNDNQILNSKKTIKSSHKVQQMDTEHSDSETETTNHAVTGPPPKPCNPPAGLKFPCPLGNHKHEVSTCAEFSNLTSLDRWEKI